MQIQQLSPDVVKKLRSGVALTSVAHCVEELVWNSIDADANCIAVRLNLPFYRIQVIDNGYGIPYDQLKLVGKRYATSKCHTLNDLKNLKSGGFRGEALASLKEVSSVLMIESRISTSTKTYCKIFTHGNASEPQKSINNRPSKGTTVSVIDFMYNMPVRKKAISGALDVEECRKLLQSIALMHPDISFTLQNESTGEMCLQFKKCPSIFHAFIQLYGKNKSNNLKQVHHKIDEYEIDGYFSTNGSLSKDIQFLYVNKHLILRTKLHKLINSVLSKVICTKRKLKYNPLESFTPESYSPSKSQAQYGIFAINISCPYDKYDVIFDPRKTMIEFCEWDKVLKLLEDAILNFLKEEGLITDFSDEVHSTFLDSNLVPSAKFFTSDIHDSKNGLFSNVAKRLNITNKEIVCKENSDISKDKNNSYGISTLDNANSSPIELETIKKCPSSIIAIPNVTNKPENSKSSEISNKLICLRKETSVSVLDKLKSNDTNIENVDKGINSKSVAFDIFSPPEEAIDIPRRSVFPTKNPVMLRVHIKSTLSELEASSVNKKALHKLKEKYQYAPRIQKEKVSQICEKTCSISSRKPVDQTMRSFATENKSSQCSLNDCPRNSNKSVISKSQKLVIAESSSSQYSSMSLITQKRTISKYAFREEPTPLSLQKLRRCNKFCRNLSNKAQTSGYLSEVGEPSDDILDAPDSKRIKLPTKNEQKVMHCDAQSIHEKIADKVIAKDCISEPGSIEIENAHYDASSEYSAIEEMSNETDCFASGEFCYSSTSLNRLDNCNLDLQSFVISKKSSQSHDEIPEHEEINIFYPAPLQSNENSKTEKQHVTSTTKRKSTENVVSNGEFVCTLNNQFTSNFSTSKASFDSTVISQQEKSSERFLRIASSPDYNPQCISLMEPVIKTSMLPNNKRQCMLNKKSSLDGNTLKDICNSNNKKILEDNSFCFPNHNFHGFSSKLDQVNSNPVDASETAVQSTDLLLVNNLTCVDVYKDINYVSYKTNVPKFSLSSVSETGSSSSSKNVSLSQTTEFSSDLEKLTEGDLLSVTDQDFPNVIPLCVSHLVQNAEVLSKDSRNITVVESPEHNVKHGEDLSLVRDVIQTKPNGFDTVDAYENYSGNARTEMYPVSNCSNESAPNQQNVISVHSDGHANTLMMSNISLEQKFHDNIEAPILPNQLQSTKNENFSITISYIENNTSNKDISSQSFQLPLATQENAAVTESDTQENKNNKISRWIEQEDPETKRTAYIDLVTGNSTYVKPDVPQDTLKTSDCYSANKEGELKKSHFFLSHDYSPFMSEHLFNEEKSGNCLTQTSKFHTELNSYIANKEKLDWYTKWQIPEENIYSCGNDVKDMFSQWDNPVFDLPVEVNCVQDTKIYQALPYMYTVLNSYRFSRNTLNSLQVVGQVDCKFIACILHNFNENCKDQKLLALFDQHAVHERIRLEELTEDLFETDSKGERKVKASAVSPPLNIALAPEEIRLLSAHHMSLQKFGINLSVDDELNAVNVFSVPSCLVRKENNELRRSLPESLAITENLIQEFLVTLTQTRCVSYVLPKTLCAVLNSQACRGAVKFGDPLTLSQCENLMSSLADCKLPFQCAHGRPSIAPILDLKKIDAITKEKPPPKLWKLITEMQE